MQGRVSYSSMATIRLIEASNHGLETHTLGGGGVNHERRCGECIFLRDGLGGRTDENGR
jgi:hypothetical protein